MLEGDTSVSSGGESGGDATASSAALDTSTGSVGSGSGGAGSLASGGDGSAPVSAVDVVGGEGAPAVAAAPTAPSRFKFAGREWETQKQAEDAYRASFGRNWEGKLTAAQQEKAQLEAELQALRRSLTSGQGGPGQGPQQAPQAPAGPHSFAEKFVKSGDLEFITGLLKDPDPEVGIQKFTVALMDRIDREVNERIDQVRNEEIAPIHARTEAERRVGRGLGVARNLGQTFPELDDKNQSPEAVEHQQAFIENLKRIPPEILAQDPEYHMQAAALMTRAQYGIPLMAQPPGTSGSPSARAALASEQAFAAATGSPIDGTGTPRPRMGGAGETPEDRLRRENAAAPGNFRTPSGKDLGFGPA